MAFIPNPRFAEELRDDPVTQEFLMTVARDAVTEIETRAPRWIKRAGAKFEARRTPEGSEARVKSPFYHLAEYGSRNNSPTPYIRPGAQAALSRRGGRLGESR